MSEENFSPQDSLLLIRSMIDKTRENISGNSRHFLLWGWLTFTGFTVQFVLKHIYNYPYHYRVWWIVVPGVLLSFYLGSKEGKEKRVSTYIDDAMKYLWTGMAISFFVLSAILGRQGWNTSVFPYFILLYGLGTFVSGCFLRFRPLIFGGLLAWVIAVGSGYLSYDYQSLAGALAILVSYIIPGHLLKRKAGEK